MDWLGSILEQIHDLRCPACSAKLDQATVRGVASEEDRVLVQIACVACGESSVAVIERVDAAGGDPLTSDDVLDAYEFLSSWQGSVSRLLDGVPA